MMIEASVWKPRSRLLDEVSSEFLTWKQSIYLV